MSISRTDSLTDLDDEDGERIDLSHKTWDLVASVNKQKIKWRTWQNLILLSWTYWENYLTWVLDTKIHLETGNLGDTIREENSSSSQDRAKTMIFIRRHLDEELKSEYLTVEDPLAL